MPPSETYAKGLSLLARRSHFRRQLEEKLRSRGYDEDSIEVALDSLTDEGLLDDGRVAEEFVRSKLRRGPIGRRRMRLELEKRGAAAAAVDAALESTYAGWSDLEATREAAESWLRRGRRDPAALARHLDRKGFTASSIRSVVADARRSFEDPREP